MKKILQITWALSIISILHAEEDSTSPPLGYNSNQQGGSRLYPSLNGVTDYGNRNGYNNYYNGPGQTGNAANSGSRYPNQQPGSFQPYPVGSDPYNMTYSGYPGNINRNTSSYPTYPNNNQSGQNIYRPGTSMTDPHRGFGNPKTISNPHQPFGSPGGSSSNPYGGRINTTRPHNTMNQNNMYPTNLSYPFNPNTQHNTNYPSPNSPNYPTNQGFGNSGTSNHSSYPRQPNYPSNPGYGNNFSSSNHSSYPRQPSNQVFPSNPGYGNNVGTNNRYYPTQPTKNTDPHRPFGQPPK